MVTDEIFALEHVRGRVIFVCISLIIFGIIYMYVFNYPYNINEKYDNIADLINITDDQKEEYFSRNFPSRQEVEDYLFDSTLLVSDAPSNYVYYFDKKGMFITWAGNEIARGKWWLRQRHFGRIYKGRSRVDVVYSFCSKLDEDTIPEDNVECAGITNTNTIYAATTGKYEHILEHEKGDIFNLSAAKIGVKKTPFELPASPIHLAEIKAEMQRRKIMK